MWIKTKLELSHLLLLIEILLTFILTVPVNSIETVKNQWIHNRLHKSATYQPASQGIIKPDFGCRAFKPASSPKQLWWRRNLSLHHKGLGLQSGQYWGLYWSKTINHHCFATTAVTKKNLLFYFSFWSSWQWIFPTRARFPVSFRTGESHDGRIPVYKY